MTICEKHIHVKKKGCKDCEQEWKEQTAASRVIRAEFTPREWDTVLAALRLWQQDNDAVETHEIHGELLELAREHGKPLDNVEIDTLIERINCSPEPVLPIVVIVGGVLQGVFHPVLDAKTAEESTIELAYDLVDFDVLEGSSDEEIANYWDSRAPSTQKYYKKFHCDDAKKFTDAAKRHKRAQHTQTGRIQVPKGKTANDRAKDRVK
jgi:hypothetical protein